VLQYSNALGRLRGVQPSVGAEKAEKTHTEGPIRDQLQDRESCLNEVAGQLNQMADELNEYI
jgi:hypothetical protein